MLKSEFNEAMQVVVSNSSAGFGYILDNIHYTNDGVMGIGKESIGIVGFGIASSITPDFQVLSAINELNQLMDFGHYWLAEGNDNEHWSLVCGFKFPYESTQLKDLIDLSVGLSQFSSSIVEAARGKLAETPHTEYWIAPHDAEPGAMAMVLLSHLG